MAPHKAQKRKVPGGQKHRPNNKPYFETLGLGRGWGRSSLSNICSFSLTTRKADLRSHGSGKHLVVQCLCHQAAKATTTSSRTLDLPTIIWGPKDQECARNVGSVE
eukprot:665412-Amphidinium_carterae.1